MIAYILNSALFGEKHIDIRNNLLSPAADLRTRVGTYIRKIEVWNTINT